MSTIKINEAKAKAKILAKYLRSQGVQLPHAASLEAVARLEHFKDWATYLAEANREAALERKHADVANWPSYVFFFREDDDCVERLYRLPEGERITVNRWRQANTENAVETPKGFVLDARVVVTDVHSTVPAVDKYGLPWFADDNKAHDWFREEIGCATTVPLEVTLHDTGDDSAAQYWFEAKVDPDYARDLFGYAGNVLK